MEDEKIIELLWRRSQEAIIEIQTKYGSLCRDIAVNVVGNERDAEEIVNEAYLNVWNVSHRRNRNILRRIYAR